MSDRGTIDVRRARYDDIVGICRTIESARTLMEIPLPPAEYPYAMQYSLDIIAQGLCWVAEAHGKVVGVAMLDRRTWPWNRQAVFLENIHLWVEPAYRKGGTATRFIEKMKSKASELSLPLSLVLTFPDGCEKLKDRFARMQGFRYMGGAYWCK